MVGSTGPLPSTCKECASRSSVHEADADCGCLHMGMQKWVREMSRYLKSIDPNHLVTVGSEGFWGQKSRLASRYNPGRGVGIYDGRTTWAAMTGSNFTAQHNFSSVDFCAAHYWPDMWVGDVFPELPPLAPEQPCCCTVTCVLFPRVSFEGKSIMCTACGHALTKSPDMVSLLQDSLKDVRGWVLEHRLEGMT